MQLVPARRLTSRQVSYEFMNRQMVWHAFTVGCNPREIFFAFSIGFAGIFIASSAAIRIGDVPPIRQAS